MNKRQKELAQLSLDAEKEVLEKLEKEYKRALKDINEKVVLFSGMIEQLENAIDGETNERQKEILISQRQSKVYQKQYQEALQGQINGILDKMQGDEYATIEQYLKECYEDGYIGTLYDLQGQGIPLIMPIDQAAAVKAIMTDSKVSKGLYTALGVDVAKLKKTISSEITRGIATSRPYAEISRNLSNAASIPLKRAKTITRTEGHRIQSASNYNACVDAKAKGADVVKQWSAALDARTRSSHRSLDGQIKEVEEPFEIGGKKAMYPGEFGDPAEDCNCRCRVNQRARWALDDSELERLKERAKYYKLDKTKDFEEYKQKYLKMSASFDVSMFNEAMKNANSPVELWMNMTEEQQVLFKNSGMKLADLYEQLKIVPKTFDEWKPANPGGSEKYAIKADFSMESVKFKKVPAKSAGWMADANINGIIHIREDGLGEDWQFIISHECGHQLANMSPELQQTIIENPGNILGRFNLRLMKFDGVFYEYNPEEAFATSVSRYVCHPDRLQELYPETYEAIDTLFKTSIGAKEYINNALLAYKEEFL